MNFSNCFVKESSDFFLRPTTQFIEKIEKMPKDTGKLYCVQSGLYCAGALVQTVASAVAVPLQLIAGIFSALNQAVQRQWSLAGKELKEGISTAFVHTVCCVANSLIFLGKATALLVLSPWVVARWDTPLHPQKS